MGCCLVSDRQRLPQDVTHQLLCSLQQNTLLLSQRPPALRQEGLDLTPACTLRLGKQLCLRVRSPQGKIKSGNNIPHRVGHNDRSHHSKWNGVILNHKLFLKETRGGLLGTLCCGKDTRKGTVELGLGWRVGLLLCCVVTCAGNPRHCLCHLLKQREHRLSPPTP